MIKLFLHLDISGQWFSVISLKILAVHAFVCTVFEWYVYFDCSMQFSNKHIFKIVFALLLNVYPMKSVYVTCILHLLCFSPCPILGYRPNKNKNVNPSPVLTTIVPCANSFDPDSFDPDETSSNLASYADQSCLTLRK